MTDPDQKPADPVEPDPNSPEEPTDSETPTVDQTVTGGGGEVRPGTYGPAASNVYEDRTTVQPAVLTEMQNGNRDAEGNPIEVPELGDPPAPLPGSREAPAVDSPEYQEAIGEIDDQTVDPTAQPATEEQAAAIPDPDNIPANPLGEPVPADYSPPAQQGDDVPPVSQPAVQGDVPQEQGGDATGTGLDADPEPEPQDSGKSAAKKSTAKKS